MRENSRKILERVDIGFELNYWKLSYRRMFYRTLWMIPVVLIFFVYIIFSQLPQFLKYLLFFPVLASLLIQMLYTYSRWKKADGFQA